MEMEDKIRLHHELVNPNHISKCLQQLEIGSTNRSILFEERHRSDAKIELAPHPQRYLLPEVSTTLSDTQEYLSLRDLNRESIVCETDK